ncbi:hypothetical protein C7E25_23725, partial [Stenotrophomonas maltophilia]
GHHSFRRVLPQSADMIPAGTAPRSVGKDGMVCGKVEKARYAEGSEGQPTLATTASAAFCPSRPT